MSHLGVLEPGSRHDLRTGISPDAPDESQAPDEVGGEFGYAHSYETGSRYDGPGVRVVLFVSDVCCAAPIVITPTPGI